MRTQLAFFLVVLGAFSLQNQSACAQSVTITPAVRADMEVRGIGNGFGASVDIIDYCSVHVTVAPYKRHNYVVSIDGTSYGPGLSEFIVSTGHHSITAAAGSKICTKDIDAYANSTITVDCPL